MATHPSSGGCRSIHPTLVATEVDIVNLDGANTICVSNRGATNPIYFTLSDTNPTVAGEDTFVCLPNDVKVINSRNAVTQVRLISAGAQPYSVEGI